MHQSLAAKVPDQTYFDNPPAKRARNPIENVWACPRRNKLPNTVDETCDEIVSTCCKASNLFANDRERVASTTFRTWVTVNDWGRWYYAEANTRFRQSASDADVVVSGVVIDRQRAGIGREDHRRKNST